MPILRLRSALGAVLIMIVLVLPGGPAGASPPAAPTCPTTRAQLAGQHVTAATKLPNLTCADLRGATFDGLDLDQVDLAGADARGASFRHTSLIQADLSGANLRGAHFEHAQLGQAELDQADAQDAFFGNADLDQANLNSADLRGADLVNASLIQADLSDADLRGSRTYWADAIQADVSGVRVNLTDPGTLQLSLLAPMIGLLVLLRSVVAVARGRGTGNGLRKAAVRLVAFGAASVFVWLIAGMLLPLQFVVLTVPLLTGAGLVVLSGLVHVRIRRPGPPPPIAGPRATATDYPAPFLAAGPTDDPAWVPGSGPTG